MQILRVRNREKDIEVVNQIYNDFHYFFFHFKLLKNILYLLFIEIHTKVMEF